jgi:hypothetical protein
LLREHLVAAVVMAALVVVFFNPVFRFGASLSNIYGSQVFTYPWVQEGAVGGFVHHDQAVFVYPRQVFVDRSLKVDHQLPLWNPLTFSGHPFFAQTGSRLAYPPMLALSVLFVPITMHDAYLMVHVFLAGLTSFAMMKQFKVRFGPAILTGIAWAFSSYGMLYYVLEMYAAVAALLPLAVLLVRRWYDQRSLASLMLGGLTLGLLYLGTSAELALMSFLFVGSYAGALAVSRLFGEWRHSRPRQRAAVFVAPIAFSCCAVAVAAVGVVPFLQLSSQARRVPIPYDELVRVYPPSRAVDFLSVFSPPGTPLSGAHALSQQVFVGTFVAILALVALCTRRVGVGMARTVAIVLVLFNLGTPLTRFLYQFPGFESLHGFSRTLFLFNFAVAVLGGVGLDIVLGKRLRPTEVAMQASAATHPLPIRRHRIPADRWRTSPAVRTVLSGGVVVVLVLATFAQLFQYGRGVNPPFQRRDPAQLLPSTPAIEASHAVIGTGPGRGRVLPLVRQGAPIDISYTLPGNTNMVQNLPSPIGYEPVLPDSTAVVVRAISGEPIESIRTRRIHDSAVNAQIFSNGARIDVLGRAGVAALIAAPGITDDEGWDAVGAPTRGLRLVYEGPDGAVYRVVGAVARATVVAGELWTRSDDAALVRFMDPGFDSRSQVILKGSPRPGQAVSSVGSNQAVPDARVDWHEDRPTSLRMTVSSPRPGWLVLLDSWDPGWKAEVDGREAAVVRANVGFRAVRVPAGTSTVSFSYEPASVVAGAVLSGVVIVATLVFVVVAWTTRRHPGKSSADGENDPSAVSALSA